MSEQTETVITPAAPAEVKPVESIGVAFTPNQPTASRFNAKVGEAVAWDGSDTKKASKKGGAGSSIYKAFALQAKALKAQTGFRIPVEQTDPRATERVITGVRGAIRDLLGKRSEGCTVVCTELANGDVGVKNDAKLVIPPQAPTETAPPQA